MVIDLGDVMAETVVRIGVVVVVVAEVAMTITTAVTIPMVEYMEREKMMCPLGEELVGRMSLSRRWM
jgi:hypothetical protein